MMLKFKIWHLKLTIIKSHVQKINNRVQVKMEENKLNTTSLIPFNDNALAKVGNSIQITNKLLLHVDEQKYIDFFIKHSAFFVDIISRYYPLNGNILEQYKVNWNWDYISQNSDINWDQQFLNQYSNEFNWYYLIANKNLPCSSDFFEKHFDKLDWWRLSGNKDLLLTNELIEKYKEKKMANVYCYFFNALKFYFLKV